MKVIVSKPATLLIALLATVGAALPLRSQAVTATPAPAAPTVTIAREVVAMGAGLSLEVGAADRATALLASERLVRAVAAVEQRLSVWRADSDISRINAAAPRQSVAIAPATAADLRWAFAMGDRFHGAFDVAAGPLVLAYGLRTRPRWPGEFELRGAVRACGADHFSVDAAGVTRRHADAALDCDAFGKGVGLDRGCAAALAAGATSVFCDFGGQVMLAGATAAPRQVAIADPLLRERTVHTIRLASGHSAATSGNGERNVRVAGRPLGHLLDPRSGRPAVDFGSVTVVAPSAAMADAAATALFILGPERGLAVARDLSIEAVFVVCDVARGTSRLVTTRNP